MPDIIFQSMTGERCVMRDLRDPEGHKAKALVQRVLDEKGGNSQPLSTSSGVGTSYTIGTAVAKKATNITGVI